MYLCPYTAFLQRTTFVHCNRPWPQPFPSIAAGTLSVPLKYTRSAEATIHSWRDTGTAWNLVAYAHPPPAIFHRPDLVERTNRIGTNRD